MSLVVTEINKLNQLFEKFKNYANPNLKTSIFVLSYGENSNRCNVRDFYGKNLKQSWEKLYSFYRTLPKNNVYIRVDLIVEESTITYEELVQKIARIKRSNYVEFGIRLEGSKKRIFLKEELTANAILVPHPNHIIGKNSPRMEFNFLNYKGYVKRKYNIQDHALNYIPNSKIYIFKTKAFFIETDKMYELKDYGHGSHVREINDDNLEENLDLVIDEGAHYLLDQLDDEGKFTYGYFPCYDNEIRNYNSIRHFSSLYALLESGEFLKEEALIQKSFEGLTWGFENLSEEIQGHYFIKDYEKERMEIKLGAQAMAILAAAKYTKITGDTQFFDKMKALTQTIEACFIDENEETIHVLNDSLDVLDKFRVIYYDGEALFSLLRAYELMQDAEIFRISQRLMTIFVNNNYEQYSDHWLSYAVNEFLRYDQKNEYYVFGLKNALNQMDSIESRVHAAPTKLELLVAAAKMIVKLEKYDCREEVISNEEFLVAKQRIFEVMDHRAYHELVTGVMFPELAMYFKAPDKIEYGFYIRNDRFRMRIDDAEHFLSGFVNYQTLMKE